MTTKSYRKDAFSDYSDRELAMEALTRIDALHVVVHELHKQVTDTAVVCRNVQGFLQKMQQRMQSTELSFEDESLPQTI